ncbi:protein adenylyltransferase SelO [Roseomonas elaeocarpi]|uniref:Protein nucleotidyltransferase YdiU n=1 Tax=Roseomonas elaeocarpi TaxID=907779 RepID=A0ABV6JT57_9PROT
MSLTLPFRNSYAELPDRFFARVRPTPVEAPRLVQLNEALAVELGLDPAALRSPEGVEVLAGNRVPEGAASIALAYAGHQFGHFVPQLGDGRALLLGEVVGRDGQRRDIQLKGSGPTPYSRGGDGRAALGPVLREYLVSEAMAALGIPTTRALAAVTTGEPVFRETPLPGAVLARVAASHIRVGTFQFFAARRDVEGLRALADHAIARHDPAAAGAPNPYRALLDGVAARQAELVARWLLVGFVHGVMNTDNSSISGETIDYGPCAFLDAYDPDTVFSSIDRGGRYAYGNQPQIALWNLAMLAGALLPLLGEDDEAAQASGRAALDGFGPRFEAAYHGGLCRKIGLAMEREGDLALAQDFLGLLAEAGADFTLSFRHLAGMAAPDATDSGMEASGAVACDAQARGAQQVGQGARALFSGLPGFDAWAVRWRQRLEDEPGGAAGAADRMRQVNPAYIPRNHLVEAALTAAVQGGDYAPFEELLGVLSHPFEERPGLERFTQPPAPSGVAYRTFCGT